MPMKSSPDKPNDGITKIKRRCHNNVEKNRKDRLQMLVDQIIDLVPLRCKMESSIKTKRLEFVVEYIKELKNKNDALMFANVESVHGKGA